MAIASGYPGIVDMSHHNVPPSPAALAAAGIVAVIYKATEGTGYVDGTFTARKALYKGAGIKWGAYHFSNGADPIEQADHFLANAAVENEDLVALDYEPSSDGTPDMTHDQAVAFVERVYAQIGRYPVIYGGHLLRDAVKGQPTSVLRHCPLWYARYIDSATPPGVPGLWAKWTIWQYHDGNNGAEPANIPGASGKFDRNSFNGTQAELLAAWPLT